MNKQTLIKVLCEEFVADVEYRGRTSKIYKNPTSQDIKEYLADQENNTLAKDVRFIIDRKTRDVYMFAYNVLHYMAASKAGIKDYNAEPFNVTNLNPRFFTGTAKIDGSSLRITSSDVIDYGEYEDAIARDVDDFLKIDWSFAQKYFDTDLNRYVKMAVGKKRRRKD